MVALVPLVTTSSRFIRLGSEVIAHQRDAQDPDFAAAGGAFGLSFAVAAVPALAARIVSPGGRRCSARVRCRN